MSDCLDKTCGTCYWMMRQPGHDECGACGNPLYMAENCPRAYTYGYYEYTTVDMDCDGEYWKPKEEGELERVARDMLAYLASIKVNSSPLKRTQDTQRFRKRLEALGVIEDE